MGPPIKEEEVVDVKKMKDETIELLKKVFITVSATKKAVTVEERKVISSAYKKMNDIRRDLVRNPPAAADDIIECRSKIETQISEICNKLSNLTVKDSYRRHLHHFKQTPTTSKSYGKLKRKASTQQPKTAGKNYLEKLILEEKDYDETSLFIETSLSMDTPKEDREVLHRAYENFISVYMEQHNVILSIKDDETKGKDLNISHMINTNRSIIVKELSHVCDKLSNPTIKEAYLHHLDEFKRGDKPKKYTQMFINKEETPEIILRSGSGSETSNSLSRITKKPPISGDSDEEEDYMHDCDEHCFGKERNYPRFGRIGNWDPKVEGYGADLLHAPQNHSVKFEDDYANRHILKMREVFKARGMYENRRMTLPDMFDDC